MPVRIKVHKRTLAPHEVGRPGFYRNAPIQEVANIRPPIFITPGRASSVMRLPLTLAAVLVAALCAGCIGAPGKTMTAGEGLSDASSAAEAWADGEGLELLGIFAVEPFKHYRFEEDGEEGEFVTHLDGNPGDGNAPGWVYGFYTGERCIGIVLAAGLGVLAEGYTTCDEDADPMPDWSVDSDEVAEILAGHDEWSDLGEDGSYAWELSNDDGTPVWSVEGWGEDEEAVYASVDAESGEVISIVHEVGDEVASIFEAETAAAVETEGGSDEDSDSTQAMAMGDELVAEVDLDAMGRIDVQVSASLVVNSFTLTVEGPYGPVAEDDLGGLANGVSQQGRSFEDLPAGHYTITLTSGGSAVLATLFAHAEW